MGKIKILSFSGTGVDYFAWESMDVEFLCEGKNFKVSAELKHGTVREIDIAPEADHLLMDAVTKFLEEQSDRKICSVEEFLI